MVSLWFGVPVWKCAIKWLLLALAATSASAPLAWTYKSGNYSWAVAVSADGRYVIAGSDDMYTYFFDTKSTDGTPLWSFRSGGYVRDVVISRDGTCAAVSDTHGSIFLFRPLDSFGTPQWEYHSDSSIQALTMSENLGYLAAGDRDGNIYLLSTGQVTNPLVWQNAIPSGVLALYLSESGSLVATATQGGLYFFGNVTSASGSGYAWSFQESTSFPRVAISEDAGYIIAGGSDGYAYAVDRMGQLVDREGVGGGVSALSISDAAHIMIVGSTSGSIRLFSIREQLVRIDSLDTRRPITALDLSANGERIATGNLDGRISMFDGSLAELVWTFEINAIVHSISISSNGQIAAAVGDTGGIYLFDEEAPHRNQSEQDLTPSLVTTVIVTMAVLILGYLVLRKGRVKKIYGAR